MLSKPDAPPSRTLADVVTGRLREAILSGHIAPGQELRQEQIAARFGVSRVPVREALRALAAEGLVTLRSHHSASITVLSRSEVQELVVIAGALDLAALEEAVSRLTESDLDRMQRCLEAMEALENCPSKWLALNLEFHLIPTEASGWSRLRALAVESRRNMGRFVVPIFPRCVRTWHRQHRAIYEAFRARDLIAARRELEAHWKYTLIAGGDGAEQAGGDAQRGHGLAATN